jgi:hypothetical protein
MNLHVISEVYLHDKDDEQRGWEYRVELLDGDTVLDRWDSLVECFGGDTFYDHLTETSAKRAVKEITADVRAGEADSWFTF